MKAIFKGIGWVSVLCFIVSVSFTACSNLEVTPEPQDTETITGKYEGTISFDKFTSYEGDTETVLRMQIEAELKDNVISISDFPVYSILSVIEDEKTARSLCDRMDLNYFIDYTVPVAGNDRVRLVLNPAPLEFSYSTKDGQQVKNIKILFGTGIKTSAYESKNLQLKLILEEIRINDVPLFIIDEQYISLQLNKVN